MSQWAPPNRMRPWPDTSRVTNSGAKKVTFTGERTMQSCVHFALMKKVVSGGPANSAALQRPCRPFGYYPVELSRFAEAGLFGISMSRLAHLRRVFTTRCLSASAAALVFTCPTLVPWWLSTTDFDCVHRFFLTQHGDSPLRLIRRLFFWGPEPTASSTPGYELSKIPHGPTFSGASRPAGSGGNSSITIIRPAPQTGHT